MGPEHWRRSWSTLTDLLLVNWDAEDLTSLSKKVSEETLEVFLEIQNQAEQKRKVVLHSYSTLLWFEQRSLQTPVSARSLVVRHPNLRELLCFTSLSSRLVYHSLVVFNYTHRSYSINSKFTTPRMSEPDEIIKLCCWVLGDAYTQVFSVLIRRSAPIDDLRKAIQGRKPSFKDIFAGSHTTLSL